MQVRTGMRWCGRLRSRARTGEAGAGDAHHHCDCSCVPHSSHSKVVEGAVEEEVEEEAVEPGVEDGPLGSGTCLATPAQPRAMQPGRSEA